MCGIINKMVIIEEVKHNNIDLLSKSFKFVKLCKQNDLGNIQKFLEISDLKIQDIGSNNIKIGLGYINTTDIIAIDLIFGELDLYNRDELYTESVGINPDSSVKNNIPIQIGRYLKELNIYCKDRDCKKALKLIKKHSINIREASQDVDTESSFNYMILFNMKKCLEALAI